MADNFTLSDLDLALEQAIALGLIEQIGCEDGDPVYGITAAGRRHAEQSILPELHFAKPEEAVKAGITEVFERMDRRDEPHRPGRN